MTFGSFLSHFRLPQDFAPTNASGRRAPLTLVKKSGVRSLESAVEVRLIRVRGFALTSDSRLGTPDFSEDREAAQRVTIQTIPVFNQENS